MPCGIVMQIMFGFISKVGHIGGPPRQEMTAGALMLTRLKTMACWTILGEGMVVSFELDLE